jgi:hypothetical protein
MSRTPPLSRLGEGLSFLMNISRAGTLGRPAPSKGHKLTLEEEMSTFKRFIVSLLLIILTACTGQSALEQNQQKWADQNLSHYRYQVSIGCFCAFRSQMPLTVEIQDGQVVSMTDSQGKPVSADFKDTFMRAAPLENLFTTLAAAQKDAESVEVTYDATYGFPNQISVDNSKAIADDEIFYTVENFEVLK